MLQAATPIPSSQLLEQDQEGFFESLPCAQSLVVEDDSDDCHDDDDGSLDSDSFVQQQQEQPYKGPKCIPSYIPLKVVPRNARLGARDELFQGYCLYSTTSSGNTSSNGSTTTTTTTDVVNVKALELQTPASPSLLRSLWETLKLSTSKTNLSQDDTSSTASASSEPQRMILYTTKRYCESASSA
jgi:hypothetical protein